MPWKIHVRLACGDTLYRASHMPICAGHDTPDAYVAWLEGFAAKRQAPGLKPVSWAPAEPAPKVDAWQTIAGFVDRHRMPGSPTGAQVVAKLQERSK